MAISTSLTGADQTVVDAGGGPGRYYGFTIRETGAAVATIRIYDGTSAAGVLLDTVQLAASESAREWYGPQGLQYQNGIYVDVVAGTVEGSVRHG